MAAKGASAPSERELKEEEELQLALALSLSESPTKISFPDLSQFEESTNPEPARSSYVSQQPSSLPQSSVSIQPANTVQPTTTIQPQSELAQIISQPSDRDRELFRFIAEVQSTSEVFTNRLNSNKMRNRPIADDAALQSLFLKVSNMHTKILDHIEFYEKERAELEKVQDKLSQVSDARAALNALREEHQEKIRQQAAEAERLRQSQLASKLEAMRQMKSEKMQYQKKIALERIEAQQMLLRQPLPSSQEPSKDVYGANGSQKSTDVNTVAQQPPHFSVPQQPHPESVMSQEMMQQYQQQHALSQTTIPTSQLADPYYRSAQASIYPPPQMQQFYGSPTSFMTPPENEHQQNSRGPPPVQTHIAQPVPKPEEDAPLISFDD